MLGADFSAPVYVLIDKLRGILLLFILEALYLIIAVLESNNVQRVLGIVLRVIGGRVFLPLVTLLEELC